MHRFPRLYGLSGCLVAAFVVLGCASGELNTEQKVAAGLSCVDDSSACISRRGMALDALTSDPTRKWIQQPASANAYASGVRMFALRRQKSALTCAELKRGKREADNAKVVLTTGAGLSTAQVARAKLLSQDVSRELAREIKRRCWRKG